ncbi:MAG TPA: DUF177 domain-containing protein [Candidatus Angelobacter sp.]|jgi:uncharacterized protein|nr:DUF177 domain-containing protein [Candidatus Angelobacter sp.]
MFIRIKDLELRKLEFDESFAPGAIDLGKDQVQTAPLKTSGRAELIRENRGAREVVEDIRFVGKLSTEVQVRCARCLDPVDNVIAEEFDLLYRPLGVDAKGDEVAITEAETEIGYYQGEGILLEDVLKEQVLLALPAKQVCRANCKGLCPQCGKDLNLESCDCVSTMPDVRWAALEDIRKKLER